MVLCLASFLAVHAELFFSSRPLAARAVHLPPRGPPHPHKEILRCPPLVATGPDKDKAEIPVCMQNACTCVCVSPCVSVCVCTERILGVGLFAYLRFCERFSDTTFDCSDSLKKIATAHLNTREIILLKTKTTIK